MKNPHDAKLEAHDPELETSCFQCFCLRILMKTLDGAKLEAHRCLSYCSEFNKSGLQQFRRIIPKKAPDDRKPEAHRGRLGSYRRKLS